MNYPISALCVQRFQLEMTKLSRMAGSCRQHLQRRLGHRALLSGCLALLWLGGPLPQAQAAPAVDPQLKQQILQVIRDNPEVILDAVRSYQQRQAKQRQAARQGFLKAAQSDPQQVIGASPIQGPAAGKILLIEFSDFQCPYCANAHRIIQTFLAKHGQEVTVVFKHFPLSSIHSEAMPAAQAAWAAGQQGKFWAYHDALFANQAQLGEALYQRLAREQKLDLKQFERDRIAAMSAIQSDLALAESLGLEGTPFLIFNGQVVNGLEDVSTLETALVRAKAATSSKSEAVKGDATNKHPSP
jgi:protein-disulfide isomerase